VPFSLTGLIYMPYVTGLLIGATVVIGAIGCLIMLVPVALFFMPCIYVISTRAKKTAAA
jgi:hypothetical protein